MSSRNSSSAADDSSSAARSSDLINRTIESIESNFSDLSRLSDRKRRGVGDAADSQQFRVAVDADDYSSNSRVINTNNTNNTTSSTTTDNNSIRERERERDYSDYRRANNNTSNSNHTNSDFTSSRNSSTLESRNNQKFHSEQTLNSSNEKLSETIEESLHESSNNESANSPAAGTQKRPTRSSDWLDENDRSIGSPRFSDEFSPKSNRSPLGSNQHQSPNSNRSALASKFSQLATIDAATWQQRIHILKSIQSLCGDRSALQSATELRDYLTPLVSALEIQLSDSLSKVVKESCLTIALIAAALNEEFEPFLPLLDPLMLLLKAKSAVIHSSADECLLTIIESTQLPGVFQSLLKSLNVQASKLKGESIGTLAVLLSVAVHRWPIKQLIDFRLQLTDLLKYLFSGSAAFPKSLKSASRLLFFRFHEKFCENGRDFYYQLNQLNQNLIYQEFPEAGLKPSKPIDSLHLLLNPADQYERLSAASKLLLNAFPRSHPIHMDKRRASQSSSVAQSHSSTPQRSPRPHLIGVPTLRLSDLKSPGSPAHKGAPLPNTPAYENLHSELSKQRAENIRLQEEIQKMQQRNIRAQQILGDKQRLEQENEVMKKQLDKNNQLQNQLTNSLATTRLEGDKATKHRLEQIQSRHQQEIEEIQQANQERSDSEIKETRMKIEQLEIQKRGLIKSNESLMAKLRACEKQIDEMAQQLERFRFDLAAETQENDALKRREAERTEATEEEKERLVGKYRVKLERAEQEVAQQRQTIEELSAINEEMRKREKEFKAAEDSATESAKSKRNGNSESTRDASSSSSGSSAAASADSDSAGLDDRMARSMEFFRLHYSDPSTDSYLANIGDLKSQIQTLEKRAKEKRIAAEQIEKELLIEWNPEKREKLQQRLKALKLQCNNIDKTLREKKEKFQQNWDFLLKHAQKRQGGAGAADGADKELLNSSMNSSTSSAIATDGTSILDKYRAEQELKRAKAAADLQAKSDAENKISKPKIAGLDAAKSFSSSNKFNSATTNSSSAAAAYPSSASASSSSTSTASARDFQALAAQLRQAISSPIRSTKFVEPIKFNSNINNNNNNNMNDSFYSNSQSQSNFHSSQNSNSVGSTAVLNVTISPENKQVHIQHMISPIRNSSTINIPTPIPYRLPLPLASSSTSAAPQPISLPSSFSRSSGPFPSSSKGFFDPTKSFSHSINLD